MDMADSYPESVVILRCEEKHMNSEQSEDVKNNMKEN
jgi:hypothetical protein